MPDYVKDHKNSRTNKKYKAKSTKDNKIKMKNGIFSSEDMGTECESTKHEGKNLVLLDTVDCTADSVCNLQNSESSHFQDASADDDNCTGAIPGNLNNPISSNVVEESVFEEIVDGEYSEINETAPTGNAMDDTHLDASSTCLPCTSVIPEDVEYMKSGADKLVPKDKTQVRCSPTASIGQAISNVFRSAFTLRNSVKDNSTNVDIAEKSAAQKINHIKVSEQLSSEINVSDAKCCVDESCFLKADELDKFKKYWSVELDETGCFSCDVKAKGNFRLGLYDTLEILSYNGRINLLKNLEGNVVESNQMIVSIFHEGVNSHNLSKILDQYFTPLLVDDSESNPIFLNVSNFQDFSNASKLRMPDFPNLFMCNPLGALSRILPEHEKNDFFIKFKVSDFEISGTYSFFLCFKLSSESHSYIIIRSSQLIVEPYFKTPLNVIPPSAICLQTVISKCLVPLEKWTETFKITGSLGYNMIHFTPLQVLGESGSSFSVRDQNSINDLFCGTGCSSGWETVKTELKKLKQNLGLLSSTDIILNHTASNTDWLRRNYHSGYNKYNSPHLAAAIELDLKIKEFNDAVVRKEFQSVSPNINSESDLQNLMKYFRRDVLEKFRMSEWFSININKSLESFSNHNNIITTADPVDGGSSSARSLIVKNLTNQIGIGRHGIHVHGTVSRQLFSNSESLKTLLLSIQADFNDLAKKTESLVASAVEGTVRYDRLQCRKGALGFNHWESLVPRYFTNVEVVENFDEVGVKTVYLANNGWVMGWDATKDFCAPGSLVYLSRQLVAWSDCVKLRFGSCPDENPFLWKWMSDYCIRTAQVFDGIRLDNCHSTPLHVAKYMLKKCREVNKQVWIYAELFTGDQDTDLLFEKELGLNALIREAMSAFSPVDFGNKFREYCHSIDCPIEQHVYPLVRRYCNPLLYDCTHDNPTPNQTRTPSDTLSTACLVAASCCSIGSTRGFDELVPALSIVSEARPYKSFIIDDKNKCSEKEDHSVLIEWKDTAPKRVSVKGEWDFWNEELHLEKKKNGSFSCVFPFQNFLPRNRNAFQFKFIVDGNWICNPALETIKDINGNINNVLRFDEKQEKSSSRFVGILPIRAVLNRLHTFMEVNNFTNLVYSQISDEICMVRRSRSDGSAFYFIARSCYNWSSYNSRSSSFSVSIDGKVKHCHVAATLEVTQSDMNNFSVDRHEINGINSNLFISSDIRSYLSNGSGTTTNAELFLKNLLMDEKSSENISLLPVNELSGVGNFEFCESTGKTFLNFHSFPPATIVIFEVESYSHILKTVKLMKANRLTDICYDLIKKQNDLSFNSNNESNNTFLTVVDNHKIPNNNTQRNLNMNGNNYDLLAYILFSSEPEELDRTNGSRGLYFVPNFGAIVYAGIAGIYAVLRRCERDSSLRQIIFEHIRSGDWLIQYTLSRLDSKEPLNRRIMHYVNKCGELRQWIQDAWNCLTEKPKDFEKNNLDDLPCFSNFLVRNKVVSNLYSYHPVARYLKPYFLDFIITSVFDCLIMVAGSLCGVFSEATFLKCYNTDTDVLFRNLFVSSLSFVSFTPSAPLQYNTTLPSLAAGFPHFATGFMRSWGRDTFISFEGIFLATRRFEEGRIVLLSFCSLIYNGIFPNLIDSGNNPRFNSRDATWFFLQAVCDYCKTSPEGNHFLLEEVQLKFPVIDGTVSFNATVGNCIHEALSRHAQGIHFTEKNAGKQIDEHMSHEGFKIDISFDKTTGFFFGGNLFNCGTWMDKMGSCGNTKGIPATPRDGLPVEIAGLLKSVLRFINKLPGDIFPHTHPLPDMSYFEWEEKIQNNFERYFYIPLDNENPKDFDVDLKLVNRKGIYKDVYKSSHPACQYQLRPNVCVAMAIAPELFTSTRARKYLELVDEVLWGQNQLGLKTLDPIDLNYNGDYVNNESSLNGYNYHQGPEWVWPLGYFLKAIQNFLPSATFEMSHLINHRNHLVKDIWMSLPELTNTNGTFCEASCRSQAWSVATIFAYLANSRTHSRSVL